MNLKKEVRDKLAMEHLKIQNKVKDNKFVRNLLIIVPAVFAVWLVPFNPLPLGLIILAITGSTAGIGTLICELRNYNLYKNHIPSAVSYREYKKLVRNHEIDYYVNDLSENQLDEAEFISDVLFPANVEAEDKELTFEEKEREQNKNEARIYRQIARQGEANRRDTRLVNKLALYKLHNSLAVEKDVKFANRQVALIKNAIKKDPADWTEAEQEAINRLK